MQRKKFIRLTTISAAAIGFSGIYCNRARPSFYAVLDKPLQLSYICDTKTIQEIGVNYRLMTPAEADAGKLENLLSLDAAGKPVSDQATNVVVQDLMSKKILQDFEKGNIVVAKGWVLAVTEARQCALFTFYNP